MPSGVGFSNVDISGLSNAGVGAGFGNMFTGNLDFQRQNYLFDRQVAANNAAAAADRAFASQQNELTRAFNASEAQKARDFQDRQ
jgi:phosphoribosylcarboxyaminoimidazole (NCAIR) mutase